MINYVEMCFIVKCEEGATTPLLVPVYGPYENKKYQLDYLL